MCIELHGEYVEYIPSLVAVACFLPGWPKDLLAPPRSAEYGFWQVEDSCDTGLLGVMQWQKVNVCLELQCDKVKCT